jgi:hypothetical protein
MRQRRAFWRAKKGELKEIGGLLKHVTVLCTLIGAIFMAGCITPETEQPEEHLSVSELLENPMYDTEVTVYGRISLLGELLCPCFALTSGGETVQVWYDLMVEDEGTERPAVSVAGLENGDWVLVTGELKTAGTHRSQNDFWTTSIRKIENLEDYDISPASEFNEVTEAESKEIARAFIENSSTYQFDGFDLEYQETYVLRCPYCWMFTFEFTSRHAGYGNRTGQMLAQVVTPHTAIVSFEQGEVTYATLDGTWNMLMHAPLPESESPGEAQAREIARNYVTNMDDYKKYNGSNLSVTNVVQARCPGCWHIELVFYLRSEKDPERTDKAIVKLTLDNWTVVDVLYAQGGVPSEKLTLEEAIAIAQNSDCVKEGALTDTYVYNANTRTWWIDLDPYSEHEGCNPACVVYEDRKTAEINWRCTGLL